MIKLSPAFLKQLWLTIGASLSFLIIGLVRGYSASAIPSMESIDPHLIQTPAQKSWIGAIPPLGAFTGSLIAGPLMQKAGRRRTLQMSAPLWLAGWLILGFAKGFPLVLVGRVISGLCVGLILATAQVYVSECCDPEIRGRLGSLPTLSMSLGILFSYVAGNWLEWRYLAFFSALFCGLLFMFLLPLPESPVWLEANGLDSSAAVKWLHLSARAVAVVKDDPEEKCEEPEPPSLFTRKVFFSSSVIKPLVVGFSLLFFQQFSGIDAVIFFTVEIFKNAGSRLDPMTATIIIGLVQLLSNGVSTMLVDRAGRRPLLLLSAAVMCLSMASLGAAFYFEFEKESWIGYMPIASLVVFMMGFSVGFGGLPFLLLGELFPTQHRSQLSAMASAVNLISMFTVIKTYHSLDVHGVSKSGGGYAVFSIGFGGLPFLLLGELFPTQHRSQLSAMASAVNLISLFTVIKTYHSLDASLTPAGTFWMYSCFCVLAFFFVLLMVPETKGKSLAEIEEHFRGKKKKAVQLQTISATC